LRAEVTEVQRIDIDDPAVETDDEARLLYEARLFTGEATEAPEEPTFLETYVEGLRHGPFRRWHLDGSLKAEGQYSEGRLVGEVKQWHENGRMAVRRVYSDSGRLLVESLWSPEGGLRSSWTAPDHSRQ